MNHIRASRKKIHINKKETIRAGMYLPECLNEPAAAFLAVEKSVSFCRNRRELTSWKSD